MAASSEVQKNFIKNKNWYGDLQISWYKVRGQPKDLTKDMNDSSQETVSSMPLYLE